MRPRVGTLVAAGVLPLLSWLALAVVVSPGTAHADPCVAVLCPTASADPSPTATHTATPTPTRSATPRPTVTYTHTRSPRPRPTQTTTAPTTTPTPDPDPTPTTEVTTAPVVTPVQKSTTAGPKLAKLAALVVGGALLLGVGGVSGLYLTRTRP